MNTQERRARKIASEVFKSATGLEFTPERGALFVLLHAVRNGENPKKIELMALAMTAHQAFKAGVHWETFFDDMNAIIDLLETERDFTDTVLTLKVVGIHEMFTEIPMHYLQKTKIAEPGK